MFSLEDLLGQRQGNEAVEQISQNVGAEPSAVNNVIQMALPAILSGMANNARTPQGAQNLNNALERDHRGGGLLDNLGGLGGMIFGNQAQGAEGGAEATLPPREADGGGILGHIFGNRQGQVAEEISQQSGLSMKQIAPILVMLAPIVMAYLGKQKQQQNMNADDLSGWLGGQQEQIKQSPQGGFLERMLDRDGDGSSMDDLASMAMNYMTNRR